MELEILTNEIEELVIAGAGQTFKGNDFRDLLRQRKSFDCCDEVRIFPCKSESAARRLEDILIARLNPTNNLQKRSSFVSNLLGINRLNA